MMLSTLGIAMGTTAAAVGRVHLARQRTRRSLDDARGAIDVCAQLLRLIRHLQQHRGMSAALLSGDRQYQVPLALKCDKILAGIDALNAAALRETESPRPCFTRNDFALWRFKWTELAGGLAGLSPEQSIVQHTQLIAQLLDWLANYGEARVELPAAEFIAAGVARNVCHRLPSLTETLGQARALGMGVTASGSCRPVGRVRLMFLATRGESLLLQSVALVDSGRAGETARLAVQELINVIRCDLLGTQTIVLTTDAYYRMATTAIDAVFDWIDGGVGRIAADLDAAKARQSVIPLHPPGNNQDTFS